MTKADLPAPPGHLSRDARRLFDSIVERYELEDEGLATLTLALEAFDQAATARRRLKREGQIIEDRFGQLRPHPAVAIHRDNLATWRQFIGLLGINAEDADPTLHPNANGRRSRRGSRNGR